MPYLTFHEYVFQRDEGLWLPNQPVVAGMAKINPFPVTQDRLKRILPEPVKPPALVKSTVANAAPQKSIPMLIPSPLATHVDSINRVFENGLRR